MKPSALRATVAFLPLIASAAPAAASAESAYAAVTDRIHAAKMAGTEASDSLEVLDLGLKAFLADPKDERAQQVLVYLAYLPESLPKTGFTAYESAYAARLGAVRSDPSLSEPCREGLEYLEINHEIALEFLNPHAAVADLAGIHRRIEALEAGRLESPWVKESAKWLEAAYGDILLKLDASAATSFWDGMAARGGDPEMVAFARGKLGFLALKQGAPPLIAFTAADGRPVDIARLPGKVVLVDFWATWCPDCLKELPEIKRLYAAYHDQGFEIVGISCEFANLQPDDSPEIQSQKLARSKTHLLHFAARGELPWPEYFDGKGLSPNDYALRFGVDSLPFVMVLGRDGRFAAASELGADLDLEPLVKKLLAQPAPRS